MAETDTNEPTGTTDPATPVPVATSNALAPLVEMLTKLTDADTAKAVLASAGAEGLDDMEGAGLLTAEMWAKYGLKQIKAMQLVKMLTESAAAANATRTVAKLSGVTAVSMLVQAPSDDDFLKSLQVGGVSKIGDADLAAAVRALVTAGLNLEDLDSRILTAIEQRCDELSEPFPTVYHEVDKAFSRKAHADVLKALGVRGSFVTEARKKAFLSKLGGLWRELQDFQGRLSEYQTQWMSKMQNPAALMTGLAAMMGGGGAGAMPNMLDAPDPSSVVDEAAGLIDRLNRMFSGAGIAVARALAADAMQLRSLLDRDDIMPALGAATKEEMLKKLGLNVTADLVRAERASVQYVLNILKLADVDQPSLPMFIVALKELGATIPFDRLYGANGAGRLATPRTRGTDRLI